MVRVALAKMFIVMPSERSTKAELDLARLLVGGRIREVRIDLLLLDQRSVDAAQPAEIAGLAADDGADVARRVPLVAGRDLLEVDQVEDVDRGGDRLRVADLHGVREARVEVVR